MQKSWLQAEEIQYVLRLHWKWKSLSRSIPRETTVEKEAAATVAEAEALETAV